MEALAGAGLMPLPSKSAVKSKFYLTTTGEPISDLYPVLDEVATEAKNEENQVGESTVKLTSYPTLVELKSMIDEQKPDAPAIIEPPSIEPLKNFIEKRGTTIEGLKDLRARMAKHVLNCKISNTVGNSASIIGGILCFVFPPVGVPVLLAGSATSLGMFIIIELFSLYFILYLLINRNCYYRKCY
jgi:hypothetical protein